MQHAACRFSMLIVMSTQPPVKFTAAVTQLPSKAALIMLTQSGESRSGAACMQHKTGSTQSPVEFTAPVAQLPGEGNDLADDELRHAARVTEWRIEHRDASSIRRLHRHDYFCSRTHKR